jgi:hypothetical protein
MKSKKMSGSSHAFFGWVIKEIAWQPPSIFLTRNQRKHLEATKRFLVG